MVRELEIGLSGRVGAGGTEAGLAEQAVQAEELGFDSFWLPESHFGEAASLPAPLLLLAAASARTSRIRLGTGSYLLPIRHPIHAAEEVAVLDRLSRGRVILGVGRGYLGSMFAAFDSPPNEKRRRFEDVLGRMMSAWRGEPVALDPGSGPQGAGRGEPVYLAPLPLQRPHPPVWVAAFGPRALEQAGRLGLPYLASPVESVAVLEDNFGHHRAAAAAAGVDLPGEVPVMRTVFVSRDRRRLAAVRDALERERDLLARSPLAAIRRGVGRALDDWAIVGEPGAVRDRIAAYRERLGMTHLIASRSRLPDLGAAELRGSAELLARAMSR